ncbi:MAG: ABC-F family ATP-binding cassette domain-containing protein [Deltaproteobacteria bacterium]|nr:ABC-F family ATP-binding cassette domain-containing protein [Deltaproteobacteria bacterium]
MLNINNISYHVGGRTIFDGASGRVAEGQKVGLVGGNGSGKTTLLKIVTGDLELDKGSVSIRKKCSVGTVSQDAPKGNKTPIQTVLEYDKERSRLLKDAETCKDANEIAYIHQRLADIDAHTAESRAAVILSGLGFSQNDQNRPLDEFSGGWKMRVALAGALFANPDLLLLDEPTNHLDLESIMWLEGYLAKYPKTLLLVSHDRDLLNGVAQNILLVKGGDLTFFTGNYDAFLKAEALNDAMEDAAIVKQELKRAHLQSFVDRFRAKATKAKQAQSRLKALEKMELVVKTSSDSSITFKFPKPAPCGSPLITMHDVTIGYEKDKPILENINLSIYDGDRIALLGANGNGKSTLARVLCNELNPFHGNLLKAGKIVIGYFAQDHLEQLNPDITALEQVSAKMNNGNSESSRSWLGRFGLGQERSDVLIKHLSGGEKTRLALSLVALLHPNFMILDEPTNHLDMDSRQALSDGLNNFDGTIVLISHDRNLVETTCDQLWIVRDGKCEQYFEDMNKYKEELLSSRNSGSISSSDSDDGVVKKQPKKQSRQDAAKVRALLAPLKKDVERCEKILDDAAKKRDYINDELSKPEIYEKSSEKVVEYTLKLAEIQKIIDATEIKWMESLEQLEEAEQNIN